MKPAWSVFLLATVLTGCERYQPPAQLYPVDESKRVRNLHLDEVGDLIPLRPGVTTEKAVLGWLGKPHHTVPCQADPDAITCQYFFEQDSQQAAVGQHMWRVHFPFWVLEMDMKDGLLLGYRQIELSK